jgi:hypothetical protein
LLVSVFLGGMVSTKLTDRPDRPKAVIHGTLVWVLFSLFLVWLIASGIGLGFTSLFGTVGSLTHGATVVAGARGDLAKSLGLDDPNRVMATLDDPKTDAVFAAATGMSTDEALEIVDEFLKTHALEAVYDTVLVPTLVAAK